MLAIKLSRVGKKKQPSYRLIIVEKTKDPWGTSVEAVGFYNPRTKPKTVNLKAERIKYWLDHGAQPTATVWNLLIDAKVVAGEKRKAHPPAKKQGAETAKKEEAKAA
ncbi:30S ribosomal protein S16 [Candidatus Uhrbacteria bacterium]|nr:30S ribosomal protein S16 [Candidatus Uhrbacteria bacterium]